MNRIITAFCFLFLGCSVNVFSQDQKKADSLKVVLKTAVDTHRVVVLHKLAYTYRMHAPDTAFYYVNQSIELGNELEFENGLFDAYMTKGLVFYYMSSHDSALKYFEVARIIADKQADPQKQSAIYSNIGNAYGDIGQNAKALDYYQKGSGFTEASNQPFKKAYLQVNIGTIYSVLDQHDSALVFYRSALEILKGLDPNDEKLYIVYGNIGASLLSIGDTIEAELAFRESYRFAKMYNNQRGLASSYDHLGVIEYSKGHIDTALSYYWRSIALSELIGAGQSISETCSHIGLLYHHEKKYDSAAYYLNKGMLVAIAIQDYYTLDNFYEELSGVYEDQGKLDSALFYHKKLQQVRDTLFSMNKSNIVGEMRAELENERKQKEIALLKEQDEKKNLILYASIALGVLLLSLVIVAYNRYLVKKKSALILVQQNAEIQQQKEIIEEKNKDITDSIVYSKRIQNAILPSDDKMRELFPQSWCCFIPKDIVSGDFFWFEQEGDYKLFGVIDCTGHGVPGALLSVVGHSILGKALSDHKLVMPDKILAFLDEEIHRTLRHRDEEEENSVQDGMDVALCCYHEKSQTIYYSGAFNPMYILRNGVIIEHKADKLMIGAGTSRYRPYQLHEVKVEKGDEVVLFSDGYADQFGGPFGKKMKYKPFKELLLSVSNKSMADQHEFIQRAFSEWKKNFDQVDDVCVVAVKL